MRRTPTREVVGRIRSGAATVLAQRGAGAVTPEAVATATGVSKQTVYNRFGGREALLDDVATAGYRRLSAELVGQPGPRPGPMGDPLAMLIEVFRRYRAFALAEPELYRFLFDRPTVRLESADGGRHGDTVFEDTMATVIRGLRPSAQLR